MADSTYTRELRIKRRANELQAIMQTMDVQYNGWQTGRQSTPMIPAILLLDERSNAAEASEASVRHNKAELGKLKSRKFEQKWYNSLRTAAEGFKASAANGGEYPFLALYNARYDKVAAAGSTALKGKIALLNLADRGMVRHRGLEYLFPREPTGDSMVDFVIFIRGGPNAISETDAIVLLEVKTKQRAGAARRDAYKQFNRTSQFLKQLMRYVTGGEDGTGFIKCKICPIISLDKQHVDASPIHMCDGQIVTNTGNACFDPPDKLIEWLKSTVAGYSEEYLCGGIAAFSNKYITKGTPLPPGTNAFRHLIALVAGSQQPAASGFHRSAAKIKQRSEIALGSSQTISCTPVAHLQACNSFMDHYYPGWGEGQQRTALISGYNAVNAVNAPCDPVKTFKEDIMQLGGGCFKSKWRKLLEREAEYFKNSRNSYPYLVIDHCSRDAFRRQLVPVELAACVKRFPFPKSAETTITRHCGLSDFIVFVRGSKEKEPAVVLIDCSDGSSKGFKTDAKNARRRLNLSAAFVRQLFGYVTKFCDGEFSDDEGHSAAQRSNLNVISIIAFSFDGPSRRGCYICDLVHEHEHHHELYKNLLHEPGAFASWLLRQIPDNQFQYREETQKIQPFQALLSVIISQQNAVMTPTTHTTAMPERDKLMFLSPRQMSALKTSAPFCAISGPPGSGKTLLLMLKAAEWYERGHNVVWAVGQKSPALLAQQCLHFARWDFRRSEANEIVWRKPEHQNVLLVCESATEASLRDSISTASATCGDRQNCVIIDEWIGTAPQEVIAYRASAAWVVITSPSLQSRVPNSTVLRRLREVFFRQKEEQQSAEFPGKEAICIRLTEVFRYTQQLFRYFVRTANVLFQNATCAGVTVGVDVAPRTQCTVAIASAFSAGEYADLLRSHLQRAIETLENSKNLHEELIRHVLRFLGIACGPPVAASSLAHAAANLTTSNDIAARCEYGSVAILVEDRDADFNAVLLAKLRGICQERDIPTKLVGEQGNNVTVDMAENAVGFEFPTVIAVATFIKPLVDHAKLTSETPSFLATRAVERLLRLHLVFSITKPDVSSSVHVGVTCDACAHTNITGIRYKCLWCSKVDLCASCQSQRLHAQHQLVKISTPDDKTWLEPFLRQQLILILSGRRMEAFNVHPPVFVNASLLSHYSGEATDQMLKTINEAQAAEVPEQGVSILDRAIVATATPELLATKAALLLLLGRVRQSFSCFNRAFELIISQRALHEWPGEVIQYAWIIADSLFRHLECHDFTAFFGLIGAALSSNSTVIAACFCAWNLYFRTRLRADEVSDYRFKITGILLYLSAAVSHDGAKLDLAKRFYEEAEQQIAGDLQSEELTFAYLPQKLLAEAQIDIGLGQFFKATEAIRKALVCLENALKRVTQADYEYINRTYVSVYDTASTIVATQGNILEALKYNRRAIDHIHPMEGAVVPFLDRRMALLFMLLDQLRVSNSSCQLVSVINDVAETLKQIQSLGAFNEVPSFRMALLQARAYAAKSAHVEARQILEDGIHKLQDMSETELILPQFRMLVAITCQALNDSTAFENHLGEAEASIRQELAIKGIHCEETREQVNLLTTCALVRCKEICQALMMAPREGLARSQLSKGAAIEAIGEAVKLLLKQFWSEENAQAVSAHYYHFGVPASCLEIILLLCYHSGEILGFSENVDDLRTRNSATQSAQPVTARRRFWWPAFADIAAELGVAIVSYKIVELESTRGAIVICALITALSKCPRLWYLLKRLSAGFVHQLLHPRSDMPEIYEYDELLSVCIALVHWSLIHKPGWISERFAMIAKKRINTEPTLEVLPDTALEELYQQYFLPMEEHLPAEKSLVTITADNEFYRRVPYALLKDSEGKMLFETYIIANAPSISVLRDTSKTLAELAAKTDLSRLSEEETCIVGNPFFVDKRLHDLPVAAEEAESVARIWSTRALVGESARKKAILARMSKAFVLHFATCIDDNDAASGAIFVTADNSASETKTDWMISCSEIQNMDLSGCALVFLSAGHTNHGLIRAFLMAGAKSVISSRTPVLDSSVVSRFVQSFYTNYRSVHQFDAPSALRVAMIEMLKLGEPIEHWGHFTCTCGVLPQK